jgi:hypothetical protein
VAFSDARNERDRAAGDTSGKSSGGGGQKARESETRNREAMARNDRDRGGLSIGGQMHQNRQAEIARTAEQTSARTSQIGNSGRTEAGLTHDTFMGMERDYRDAGNSTADNVGNTIAGLLGFREHRPTKRAALDRVRGTANPTSEGVDMRANWGFDVIGALANFAGLATGVPVGAIYNAGRWTGLWDPPTVTLGPDVFGQRHAPLANQTGAAPSQGGQRADLNSDKGTKRNGLLARPPYRRGQPAPQPSTTPPTTPPATPPAGGPSKLPTPQQKFQAPSYYAGDWQFDETTQQVVWVPKRNGLLAA